MTKPLFQNYNVLVLEDGEHHGAVVHLLTKNGATICDKESPYSATHIVSKDPLEDLTFARNHMIPVVTPEWVFDTVSEGKQMLLQPYNTDQNAFLRKCFITINSTHQSFLETAVAAFGGQASNCVTKYTTHVVCDQRDCDEHIIAQLVPLRKIECLWSSWLIESLRWGLPLDEKDFTIEKELSFDKPDWPWPFYCDILEGKVIYLPEAEGEIKQLLKDMIVANGGTVKETWDDEVQICICEKRGHWYEECQRIGAICGNLNWLLSTIVNRKYEPPKLLNHFPIPTEKPEEFKGLTFSMTNYYGAQRAYLTWLVEALGGTMIRSLTNKVDYLLCGRPCGDKFDAVMNNWPHIKVRSHTWIEKCFREWKLVEGFGYIRAPLKESEMIGYTEQNADPAKEPTGAKEVKDSESEDVENTSESTETHPKKTSNKSKKSKSSIKPEADFIKSEADSTKSEAETSNKTEPFSSQRNELSSKVSSGLSKSPSAESPRHRKAAMKAAARLHSDIEDLNAHQQKISKKLKKELARLRLVLTGCDELSPIEMLILNSRGIEIASDYTKCNVIVAPRVMRTEKFLTGLAAKPIAIVRPEFLKAVIEDPNALLEKYMLELDELPIKIPELLRRAKAQQGLFKGIQFNVTLSVPGGANVLNRILTAHGMSHKVKMVKSPLRAKQLLRSDDGKCYLLTQENTLTEEFLKVCDKQALDGVVVEWDWVVKCIFSMERS